MHAARSSSYNDCMKRVTSSLPFGLFFSGAAFCALALAVACSSGTTNGSSSGGGGGDSTDADIDSGSASQDSGQSVTPDSSAAKDGGYPHRFGASDVNGTCEFNRDCKEGLRCECVKGDCACKVGVRGEGTVGSPCTTNEECGSAVCFDDRLCTDECTANTECKGELANCKGLIGFSAKLCLP